MSISNLEHAADLMDKSAVLMANAIDMVGFKAYSRHSLVSGKTPYGTFHCLAVSTRSSKFIHISKQERNNNNSNNKNSTGLQYLAFFQK